MEKTKESSGPRYHLRIQLLDPSLKIYYKEAITNHCNNPLADSGFDLFICEPFDSKSFTENKAFRIDHKVACAVFRQPRGSSQMIPSGYYMHPRSSISKTPYRLANATGVIDAGYRGPLCAKVDRYYDVDYPVSRGHRLFQLCTPDLSPFASVQLVNGLSSTSRGAGGFGSTGR